MPTLIQTFQYFLVLLATLMGINACMIYFAVTFSGSLVFGVVLSRAGGEKLVKQVRLRTGCCATSAAAVPEHFIVKLKAAARSAWGDFRGVLGYLLVGVAIGAGIHGYVPQQLVADLAGPDNPLAIPTAAVIGVPLYIRGTTVIPIGLALTQKGMSMGAAFEGKCALWEEAWLQRKMLS